MPPAATDQPIEMSERAARVRLALTRMARRLRQEASSELGLSAIASLATIERHGPINPSELATRERIQRPTATRVISRLEQTGMVERTSDPEDGRCSIIAISVAGAEHLAAIRQRKNAYLVERMAELPDRDVATLERASKILERLLAEERA